MKGLCELLAVQPGLTAIIGGGGKTTLMLTLARELAARGTVIVTTSTKLLPPEDFPLLCNPTAEELKAALGKERAVCVGAPQAESGKLGAPSLGFAALAALADYVLVEADGSRGLPLKAHAAYEPVIPASANQCIYVIGLDCLGAPLREVCHRAELFAELNGCGVNEAVTAELVAAAVQREKFADRYFINKADDAEGREKAAGLAVLLDRPAVIGSLRKGEYECW